MSVKHRFQTTQADGPDASLVGTEWNDPHEQKPYANENLIPSGEYGFIDVGVSPTRVIGWAYNDNGTILYVATITV